VAADLLLDARQYYDVGRIADDFVLRRRISARTLDDRPIPEYMPQTVMLTSLLGLTWGFEFEASH
jgi:hypothetical protein